MALIWGLAIPLPAHLGLLVFGFVVCGIWVLLSRYRSQKQTSKQHKLKKIQKPTVSELEESSRMEFVEANLTCISGLPVTWTQEYLLWSIERSLRQIFHHLENARSSLMELRLPESQDVTSSSASSDLMAQEVALPCCYCKKAKRSTNHSISSASSNNSPSLSYFPVFPERTTWQFQSNSAPVSSPKQPLAFSNQGTSLSSFQLTDPEKTELLQNLAALSPLKSQSSFISSILEPPNPCQQQETAKDKSKSHSVSDHGTHSISYKRAGLPGGVPLQLSPVTRGELEKHTSWEVSTLQEQTVPLPVRKSRAMLHYQMDVQGVLEPESPQTQLPTPSPQNTDQNTIRSQELPSFHLHVNIGVDSGLNRTETKIPQSHISVKQLQSGDDRQILASKPLVISVGTPPPRHLGVNIIQEETTLLKKDPRHVLELSIEERVPGLPEKRAQPHKTQVTNMELAPRLPHQVTDSIKITPLALLQVMDSMGMIPESHSEVIESVSLFPQSQNQVVKPMETVGVTPRPAHQIIESMKVISSPQHQVTESKTMISRLSQATDNVKVTPRALLHVMDSMGMINKLHPYVTESHHRPQHQVIEPVKMGTLLNHQAIKPGEMRLRPQHPVVETVEMSPGQVRQSVSMTSGSQNQAMKQVKVTTGPIHPSTQSLDMVSTPLHQVTDYTQVTPVTLQAMDFMGPIPPVQPNFREPGTPGSQSQAAYLIPMSTQPDGLTSSKSSTSTPLGAVEPVRLPSKVPSEMLSGGTLLTPHQSVHALKETPVAQRSPTGMITPSQSQGLTPQPASQVKEPLESPSGLQARVLDSVGMTPQYRDTLTSALLHQVVDPSRLTPEHQVLDYSEVIPRHSHDVIETTGLASDTWTQMKTPKDLAESHQTTESLRKTPGLPGQGTEPIGISQTPWHQDPESEVLTTILPPQGIGDTEMDSMLRLQAVDAMTLFPGSPDVKSENLITDPELQSMKSAYITPDLIPQMEKYGQLAPTMKSMEIVPECQRKNVKSEALTNISQWQRGATEQAAPESQLQGMKVTQLALGPQSQSGQFAEMAPDPQLETRKSIDLVPSSQFQGIKYVHLDQPQEFQDIKTLELTQRPPLEDINSVELALRPCLQNTSSDKPATEILLKDEKSQEVERGRVIPEAQVQSLKVGELMPGAHLPAVNSVLLNAKPNYHTTALEGSILSHQALDTVMISEPGDQATGVKLTSDTCHPVEESARLTRSSVGISPTPQSQTLESMEVSSPSSQGPLEPELQVEQKMGEAPASQNTVKDTLNLLSEPEVQSMKPEMLSPQPQPSGVKLIYLNLGPSSSGTALSDTPLRLEDENTESVGLTLPQVDKTQRAMSKLYLGTRSMKLSPGLGGQHEKSESLQHLKPVALTSESSPSVIGPSELTTGSKPLVKDLTPGPQLEGIKSGQMELEAQLQNEKSVDLIQQLASGVGVPEKPKPESGLQSMPLEELTEGTRPQCVKSVDSSLGQQQPRVAHLLTPGQQLQTVRLPELSPGQFLHGEGPVMSISGPVCYGVTSDETIPGLPVQEITLSDFKVPNYKNVKFIQLNPESQPQGMKSVELNSGPSLKDISFSDLTTESKHQGFRDIQLVPGVQVQDIKSQGHVPESFWQLSQEPQVDDVNLTLPMGASEFHSMSSTIQTSEQHDRGVISEEVNSGLRQQDIRSSELDLGPKLQGVRFGDQTPGSIFHGVNSVEMTPELGLHDPKLTKVSIGLQDMNQVGLNSVPWLQDVEFFDFISGTQPEGKVSSKLAQEPHLEYVQPMVQIPVSRLQGLKSEKLTPEPQLEDMTSVVLTRGPHLRGMKSMHLTPKPELGQIKSRMLTPRPQAGDMRSAVLIPDSKVKGLKSKLLSSVSQEDKASVALIPEQCLEGMKSTATTLSPQLEGGTSMTLIPSSSTRDLKNVELLHGSHVPDVNAMKCGPRRQGKSSAAFAPGTLLQVVKSIEMLQRNQLKGMKPKELTLEPQVKSRKHVDIIPCLKQESLKSVEVTPDPQLQCGKSTKLTPRHMKQEVKYVNEARKQGVRSVDLASKQQFQGIAPVDLTLGPGQDGQIYASSPEWKCVNLDTLNRGNETENRMYLESIPERKSQGIKSTDLNSKLHLKDMKSFELTPEPVIQDVQDKEFQCKSQLQKMKSHKLTSGSTLEAHLQGEKTLELNREAQFGYRKSGRWLPSAGVQSEESVGSNLRLQLPCVKPAGLKQCSQLWGVESSELTVMPKLEGTVSVEFNPELSQLQQTQTSKLFPASELQKGKIYASASEPQLQGIKMMALNKEPQFGSTKSIQWIPGPDFQGVKSLGLHFGPRCQGIKPVKLKPSTQSGRTAPSKMTLGPKLQGDNSKRFNVGPQVQCVKTPELSPELQKRENVPSISEVQFQDVKTVASPQGPQPGNMRSIQWVPVPNFQVVKSMLNPGLPSKGVTAEKLKSSIQLRDVQTSELTPRPHLHGRQPSVSAQERQPHRFKPTDLKSGLQLRSMKSCESNSRSKLSGITSMMFKPGFNLQDVNFSELDPGLHLQEVKPLESSSTTQVQGMKSLVYIQKPQLPKMKSRILSQGPRLQDGIIQLIRTKSSELALQKQPQHMKSKELNAGLQRQCRKYSNLTTKTKSQYMKYTKSSPSSQLKGTDHGSHDLAMGTKTRSVKIDFKPGPQMQGIKSSESVLRTKPQKVKLVRCESNPQLHDVESSRTIMGIKLQGIKPMNFSPGPHLQGVTSSEVILEKKFQGGKSVDSKHSPKLQGEKTDPALGKNFPGMKLVRRDSATHLQDKKSSELLGIQLQAIKSIEQHFKCTKSFEAVVGTKAQCAKPEDFNSGQQIQSKKSELVQGGKLKNVKSVEFSHSSKSQDITFELSSETKVQKVDSLKVNLGSQLQDMKYSKLILGTKFQNVKALGCSSGPHFQSVESSEATPETKLQKEKSVGLTPQPLRQDVKSCQSTLSKIHGGKFLQFSSAPQLPNRKLSMLTPEIHLQGMKPTAFKLGAKVQGGKSSGLSCEPGPQSHCKDVTFNTGPKSHNIRSSELIPDPDSQSIKSQVFCCGPLFQDVNSACISDPNFQCVNSTGCTPRPHLQAMNSFASIPGQKPQCLNSAGCNPEPHLHGMNSSASISRPEPQCVNSTGCNPGPHLQGVNSACTARSKPQCLNSAGCNPGIHLQGVNSACTPGPHIQCGNSTGCNPGPHLQGMKLSEPTDVSKLQGMKSSDFSAGTEIKREMCMAVNSGQNLQDLKSELTPEVKFLGVTPIQCNPLPRVQCVNFSELNTGSKLQCVNSMECKFEPHLQDIRPFELTSETKLQGMRSPKLQPVPELQGIESVVQCLQDVKCELTPRTKFQSITPMKFHSGPQFQGMYSSELNSESKTQCKNSMKLSPGPQVQNTKPTELTPESESQGTKSVLFNSGPHLQGVKFSDLMLGAKFQGVPFLENQLSSQQQIVQPVFTLGPQSNDMKSVVVLPNPLLKDVKSVKMSKQSLLCSTNAVKLTSGFGMQDLEYEVFTLEPCFQKVKSVPLKLGAQPPSVDSLGLASCLRSQCVKSVVFAPKPCFQDVEPKQLRLGSQEQSMDYQKLTLGWHSMDPMVMAPEPARKFLSGPALTTVKFSNLVPESQQQGVKSWDFTPESKWESVKHVKLSSVSLQQTVKSMELLPRSLLQSVKPGNQFPRTNDQITASCEVIHRPEQHLVEYAEMTPNAGFQVSQSMGLISAPTYQTIESSETTKALVHKGTESVEKLVGVTPKLTGKVMESLGMPLQLDLQAPGFVAPTPVLRDQGSKPLELTPEKSYQVPETLELLPHSRLPFKDMQELYAKQVTESKEMATELKHVTEAMGLTYEARLQGKRFVSMTPKPVVSQATEHTEKTQRPCPRDLEPVALVSEGRPPRQESVVVTPKSLHHAPASASEMTPGIGHGIPVSMELTPKSEPHVGSLGIGLGHQLQESVNLTSKQLLQMEESLKLSPKQISQVVRNVDSVDLVSESWHQGLTQPQSPSVKNSGGAPAGPLDKLTEYARTQLQVARSVRVAQAAPPKVAECVKVTPGPPHQVVKSVTTPEPAQLSKYGELTPKLQDVRFSEFTSSLWLQNVNSKNINTQPTHQILEIMELSGFQIIKTVLIPGPLLQVVKSEKLAPGPIPQVVEPIGVATGSEIKVLDCSSLLPKLIKPIELTTRPNSQINSTELTLQQASPFDELTILTHAQRLQTVKAIGIKAEPPKVVEFEDLNQGQLCLNKESEMLTSEALQIRDYFSRFLHSPSIPAISRSVKTSELGGLQEFGMPDGSRTLDKKNLGMDTLQLVETYTDPVMTQSSSLPLPLHNQLSDQTVNTGETTHPETWGMDVTSKEGTVRKHMEKLEESLQNQSPYPLQSWRAPSENFQSGSGVRRGPIRSFLGRQQNIWESHACRQRLPRKYLSTMLMLGNVLGTTMERKTCSQTRLAEGATEDICQSIQNLFGVPAELMEFSQTLLDKSPSMISQTSVIKNYIQRHTLCHGYEKRMAIRMWTRGSTSSIIRQYSGTRLGIKKTNSKLSDIFREAPRHTPVSCAGGPLPPLVKPESSLRTLYNREDSSPMRECESSQGDMHARTFESQHSFKPSHFLQAKTDFSEQLHWQDLQLKIAAKLLRSQIPPNMPPPLASGLVLKYPICLQCGRCSGFNCCHKLQSTFGSYLLIYPQLHLVSTPEGHGEIRLHLGFRLQTGKKQVSKYRGRDRSDIRRCTTLPPQRETSKSPTPTQDFQSGSSQSPPPVQGHIRQRQWGSPDIVGKTEIRDLGHYEFHKVHSLSESDFESNRDRKWARMKLKKTSAFKYPMKRITEKLRPQNTKLSTNNTASIDSPSRKSSAPVRKKNSGASPTNTASLRRQSKKSSQPKFMQLLFQGLRQAFQTSHRIIAFAGQKPRGRMRLDNLWSSKNYHPKQKAGDYCLPTESKRNRVPVIKQSPKGSTIKQEDILWGARDEYRSTQQSEEECPFQPRSLQLLETTGSQTDKTFLTSSVIHPLGTIQNESNRAKNYNDELSSQKSKNLPKQEARFQAQGRSPSSCLLKRTSHSRFKEKHTHRDRNQHSFFREKKTPLHDALEKSPGNPSERMVTNLFGPPKRILQSSSARRHGSPSRKHHSPSERTPRRVSDRSYYSPSEGRGGLRRRRHSSSKRRPRSPSKRSPRSLSKRSPRSPSERSRSSSTRRPRSPSKRRPRSPSKRRPRSPSTRRPRSPSIRRPRSPSTRRPRNSSTRRPRSSSTRRPRSSSTRRRRSPSKRRRRSPSKRSPRSSSTRRPRSSSTRRPRSSSTRRPRSSSTRRPRSPSKRRPRRPLQRSSRSPSERCHSPSKRSRISPSKRMHHSPSERSYGSLSARTPPAPRDRRRHTSSGRTRRSPFEERPIRPSAKSGGDGSERIHPRPPEKSGHGHSERSPRHHSPKETLGHGSPKDRPRHSLSQESRSCSDMAPRDHTNTSKSWTSLEA